MCLLVRENFGKPEQAREDRREHYLPIVSSNSVWYFGAILA
jgi:hypothetical protein